MTFGGNKATPRFQVVRRDDANTRDVETIDHNDGGAALLCAHALIDTSVRHVILIRDRVTRIETALYLQNSPRIVRLGTEHRLRKYIDHGNSIWTLLARLQPTPTDAARAALADRWVQIVDVDLASAIYHHAVAIDPAMEHAFETAAKAQD